ncbi:MAG: hypothetical protein BRD43_06165 [Bacteroidetes bacterium QS_4_64_154]|nr:MAG: hypothetical protein BRD43_06165 [Bacteroidetes bacterium QS_4_64_154]
MYYAPRDFQSSRFGLLVFSVLFFLSAALGGGCSLSGHEDGYSLRLKTDRDEFVADSSTTIQLTVTNTGERSAYFVCDGSIVLEKLSGERVTDSWGVHGFLLCGRKVPIKPGEEKSFEMGILPPGDDSPALADLAGGKYRLRIQLYQSEAADELVDRKERLSNTFKITQ